MLTCPTCPYLNCSLKRINYITINYVTFTLSANALLTQCLTFDRWPPLATIVPYIVPFLTLFTSTLVFHSTSTIEINL